MIRFSNSTLGTFRECPRCFWLEQNHKIKRPRGIFPSLPGGMDRKLKIYFDVHRAAGTKPPEMESLDGAMLYANGANLERWRNWRNLLVDIDGIAQLSGAIDDLIVWADGMHSPYDYKTRGAAPVEGASEEYYGAQLDIYHLLMEQGCGLKCNGSGFLGYYWPDVVDVNQHGVVKFNTTLVKLGTDPARAVQLVHDAVKCLEAAEPPEHAMVQGKKGMEHACEYCEFVAGRHPHDKTKEPVA